MLRSGLHRSNGLIHSRPDIAAEAAWQISWAAQLQRDGLVVDGQDRDVFRDTVKIVQQGQIDGKYDCRDRHAYSRTMLAGQASPAEDVVGNFAKLEYTSPLIRSKPSALRSFQPA
jgi:hypothetical protein